jgi:formylglycine-generating enzyme required for sulfatase activity
LCLLVRIGDEPAPTPVRQREVIKPRRSGRLFVQANDLDLQGNSDALQLTVTGGLRLGDAAAQPMLLPIQAAERDWRPILARAQRPGANPDQVRKEVFDFCQRYAGTPHVSSAARLLEKLPLVTNSIGMKLALIPPGEFMMGSDASDPNAQDDEFVDKAAGRLEKHRVRITRPFYLGVTEVTRGQFRQFADDTGYKTDAEKEGNEFTWRDPHFEQTDEHPVVYVSWNDAVGFCEWLSRKDGKTYRLPTEAEWEYACRAGTTTWYSFGDDPEGLAAVGNVLDATAREKSSDFPDINVLNTSPIAASDGYVYTAPVGRFRPNAWGLFDMHGNVWEYCTDWYGAQYYKQSPLDDPPGPGGATARVARGGAWRYGPREARLARRGGQPPGIRDWNVGFRLALVPSDR